MLMTSKRVRALGILLSLSLGMLSACTKDKPEAKETEATPKAADSDALKLKQAAEAKKAEEEKAQAEKAEAEKPVEDNHLSCANNEHWQDATAKGLSLGKLQLAKDHTIKENPLWENCEGRSNCRKLVLSAEQTLLGLGIQGNNRKLIIGERCGLNNSVIVSPPHGPVSLALRGTEMRFNAAMAGGDRFLLAGAIIDPDEPDSESAAYLVTGREGEKLQLEAVANRKEASLAAAASQIVSISHGDSHCTTQFWKIGIGECDFDNSPLENSALLGQSLIFPEDGKGMKWTPKDGKQELLPALTWAVTDGINVVWSANDTLYTAQPRWDLPTLSGEPAIGAAGEAPLASGCGRILQKRASGWALRNIKLGTEWLFDSSALPDDIALERGVILGCDDLISSTGYRISFKSFGSLSPVAKVESAPAPTADADEGKTE